MDRDARLSPLGGQRLRVLDCLGGNNRWAPGYFEPDTDADVFSAFRTYVARLSETWAAESEPSALSLLAAARLLTGELAAAHTIVDTLPAAPVALDHGAGVCAAVPVRALSTVLPVPPALADSRRWLAGSPAQAALRAWLSEHAAQLQWREAAGIYELAARGPADGRGEPGPSERG